MTGRRSTINLMNQSNPFTLQGGLTCFLSRPLQDVLVAQALTEKPLVEVGVVVGRDGVEPPETKSMHLQCTPLPLTVYLSICDLYFRVVAKLGSFYKVVSLML